MFDLFQFVADCREAMAVRQTRKDICEKSWRVLSPNRRPCSQHLANRNAPDFTSCINPAS